MPWYRSLAWSFYLRFLVLGMGRFQAGVVFLAWISDSRAPTSQDELMAVGEFTVSLQERVRAQHGGFKHTGLRCHRLKLGKKQAYWMKMYSPSERRAYGTATGLQS